MEYTQCAVRVTSLHAEVWAFTETGLANLLTGWDSAETRDEEIKLPADTESTRTDKDKGVLVTCKST